LHFQDPESVVLDIGANYGYSATSLWASGSRAAVVSFEPIAGYGPVLAEIARVVNEQTVAPGRARRYEYHLMGLSDRAGELIFHIPVLNGRVVSALTSASEHPHIPSLTENIVFHMHHHLQGEVAKSLRMHSFSAPITTLDTWVRQGESTMNLQKVVALKIDVEGYEAQVLAGGYELLCCQRPLIMAESGHTNVAVRDLCLRLGYRLAEREGNQLRITDTPTTQVNGFFLHPDLFDHYRDIGLIAP
jgi:FkbM family methyltransferase